MEAQEPKIGSSIAVLGVLLLLLGVINYFFVFEYPQRKSNRIPAIESFDVGSAYILPLSQPSYIPILDTAIPEPVISAKSAAVYDSRSGRYLYEKNSDQRLPVASLTKIMSAVVAIENLNLEDVATISPESLKVDGQKQTLFAEEKITVGNLIAMMLIESSNDAAYAVANYAKGLGIDFIIKMNEKATKLGMSNTKFLDPAGLDDQGFSTAEDLSKLTKYAFRYQIISDAMSSSGTTVKSIDEKIHHAIVNTNILLGSIPNIIGGKTGYTDNALGCLILAVNIPDKNDSIVSVVLGSNDRFGDTEKLVNWVKKAYRWD